MYESICVIDFEASSLQGWPIEVGVSMRVSGAILTWSSLIRPAPKWSMDDWAPAAEAVHGIARAQLNDAPTPAQVATELMRLIKSRRLLSDAPDYDGRWLRELLLAGGSWDPVDVDNYDAYAHEILRHDPRELDRVYERLARVKVPHRAGSDAEILMRALAG